MTLRVGVLICLFLSVAPAHAQKRAKNVILLIADACGLPTLSAASLHGYGEPQKLYLQGWPNIALSDTSTTSNWVSDSAAGMTAIVTGVKTHNGVISQGPDTVRGKQDGTALKTVLEFAEERGLSSGVLTNVNIADATPAACYAHANNRSLHGEIFLQIFKPRFGDGVDVVIGAGRKPVAERLAALGHGFDKLAATNKRPIYSALADAPADNARPIVVQDGNVDVPAASRAALRILSKNRRGYFLMIEWDAHADNPERGLGNVVAFDKLIREIASTVNLNETLLLFTADHSFEVQTVGGRRGQPLLEGLTEWRAKNEGTRNPVEIPALRIGRRHTGEEVVAAALGPGASQVRGFLPNTQLFQIMMNALGLKPR